MIDHTHRSRAAARHARLGIIFFLFYLALYATFVFLSAFRPDVMSRRFDGVNLAVISGFGLIIAAIVLALLYTLICRALGEAPGDQP